MPYSVLVTKRIYPEAVELLRRSVDEVDYMDSDDGMSADELLRRSRNKQAIVSQLTDKFTPEVISQLSGIKAICNVAVGYDNIDVPAANRAGILVTNTPDVLTETTADFAWALLMAAARRVVEGHAYIHSGQWRKWAIDLLVGHDIHHKTLGIFGMGRIGQAVARRAKGFNMRVLYHDAAPVPGCPFEFLDKVSLLKESDFVSLHVPLLDATRKLIGEPELRMMKASAILINTSRGPVVDEAAVARALREKWIAYAALDVFEKEPNVHSDLLALDNIVLAPHIASASLDTRRRMSLMACENAIAAVQGVRPPNLVQL